MLLPLFHHCSHPQSCPYPHDTYHSCDGCRYNVVEDVPVHFTCGFVEFSDFHSDFPGCPDLCEDGVTCKGDCRARLCIPFDDFDD